MFHHITFHIFMPSQSFLGFLLIFFPLLQDLRKLKEAETAQLVDQWTFPQEVPGSISAPDAIPLWVGKWVPALMVSAGVMCIPARFTVPRSSLMAHIPPRELRWKEMALIHKGMTQLIVLELGSYKLHLKCFQ